MELIKESLFSVFQHLKSTKILVMGDFMLDAYTQGKVKRISPEAPIPVLTVDSYHMLPGGAGNVALNLISLGAEVVVLGRIARDSNGDVLQYFLEKEGIDVSGLYRQIDYETPIKNRIIAESQQIVRVDSEKKMPLSSELEEEIIAAIPQFLDGVAAIAVSDYAKGFLTKRLLASVIEAANQRNITVLVDPKGTDFSIYKGATVIKPNLSEAIAATGLDETASIDQIGENLLEKLDSPNILITRSNKGMSLFTRYKRMDFPVKAKEVVDVTGAGDTVLSTLALAMASNLSLPSAIQLANLAAGLVVEHLGCARVSLEELASRLLELDSNYKIFDEKHLHALQRVLKNTKTILLTIEGIESLTVSLFNAVKTLSSQDRTAKLIVYVKNGEPNPNFLELLSSLPGIDFIITEQESLKNFLDNIQPDYSYCLQNDSISLSTI